MDKFFWRDPRPRNTPAEGEHKEPYERFKNVHERHDIYEFSKELATYLKEQDIKNTVFIDRSARPAWIGVDEYWNQNYADTPKPGFYFVNPDGLQTSEALMVDRDRIMDVFVHLLETGEIPEETNKSMEEIAEDFTKTYKKLMEDKDESLVLFDACAHTGGTIRAVTDVLQNVGFTDVRVITANEPDWHSNIEPAEIIDSNVRLTSCYPFGTDHLVKKTTEVTTARKEGDTSYGNQARKEIRQIVRTKGQN